MKDAPSPTHTHCAGEMATYYNPHYELKYFARDRDPLATCTQSAATFADGGSWMSAKGWKGPR